MLDDRQNIITMKSIGVSSQATSGISDDFPAITFVSLFRIDMISVDATCKEKKRK